MAEEKAWSIVNEHPSRTKKLIKEWDLFNDSYLGGRNYLNGDYLFSHTREHVDDFKNRKDRAYFLNYCAPGIDLYSSFIFNSKIVRESTLEDITNYWSNVDGNGHDMNHFAKEALTWAQVFGWVACVTDRAVMKDPGTGAVIQPASKLEEGSLYSYLVFPHRILDWLFDEKGGLEWITIEEGYPVNRLPGMSLDQKFPRRVRVWTKESWQLWEVKMDGTKVVYEIVVAEGRHGLGKVPVDILRNRDMKSKDGPILFGQSTLSDIAYINRDIFNLSSLLDEIIYEQTFSLLVVPDDMEIDKMKMGTHAHMTFPHTAKHLPTFIAPDVKQAEIIINELEIAIKRIKQLFGIGGKTNEDSKAAKSGEAWAWEHIDKSNLVAEKADHSQDWEMQIGETVTRWNTPSETSVGDKSLFSGKVDYPDSYDVTDLAEDLENAMIALDMQLGESFDRWLRKKTAMKIMKSATEEERKEVSDEIDSQEIPPKREPGSKSDSGGPTPEEEPTGIEETPTEED